MSINRFAILTRGYDKPGAVAGSNFDNAVQRGVFSTRGYFPRRLWQILEYNRGYIRMGNSMRLE